jgi:two-component system, OmpR family, response regulator RegX3
MTRVLLVEDEESYRDALSYLQRKEGFQVAVCPAGPDALAMFDRDGADLVLVDLMPPRASWHRRVPEPAPKVGCAGDHADR